MLLGAHQSIAGGLHKAWELAAEDGCAAIQIFTKNKGAWADPVHDPGRVRAFRDARATVSTKRPVLAHGSYLANLCAKDGTILERSRASLLAEVMRCDALGVDHVVFHPGAHLGRGTEAGIALAAEQIAWVLERSRGSKVSLAIENTAGQGSCIAASFAELGALLRACDGLAGRESQRRVGVCIDTCHAFAAGYDLRGKKGFDAAFGELDHEVSIARIRAFHVNDSKGALGSRVDRHARIGEGELGYYPFWRLMNDRALASVAGVIETAPVVAKDGKKDRFFKQQIALLRGFAGAPRPRFSRAAGRGTTAP